MTQKSLLHAVAAQIANGYETAEVPMYSEQLRMPDRKVIIKIIENLQKVFFPAYFAGGTVSHVSAETFAEFLLGEIYTDLREQVHLAFSNTIADESELRERTNAVCDRFLCRLPQIQTILMKDVTANFDGDPAAGSKEEVIFSYPGLYAIFVYRVAHELYESGVPLIPRIMSEYAHGATGIDINPGAQIGEYFFIDHGTGIVVGETTVIGDHVKLYQGVTLGALSPRHGHAVTGKRHPTVGDNATIYSGASILGGKTVIGANSVIGGNSFITESIAPNTKASTETPRMIFRVAKPQPGRSAVFFAYAVSRAHKMPMPMLSAAPASTMPMPTRHSTITTAVRICLREAMAPMVRPSPISADTASTSHAPPFICRGRQRSWLRRGRC